MKERLLLLLLLLCLLLLGCHGPRGRGRLRLQGPHHHLPCCHRQLGLLVTRVGA